MQREAPEPLRAARAVTVLAQHPVAAGLGTRSGVGMDGATLGDAEALGGQRLDADIVDTGGDRGLDARLEQLLEGAKSGSASRSAAPGCG